MNCQSARGTLAELLDHRTPPTALPAVRAHLAGCPDCQREFAALRLTAAALDSAPTPPDPPRLRRNFYAMLEEEKQSATNSPAAESHRRARPVPAGGVHAGWRRLLFPSIAGALLAIGFMLGRGTRPAVSAAAAPDSSLRHEMIALQEQVARQRVQLNQMTTLVSYSILQQQRNPANTRLRDVLVSAGEENPGDRILDDLVGALTLDPSANVRLRAIEALYPHAEHTLVRAGVLAALPREQNPLVQLELIDFVAATQEHEALPALEKMAVDGTVDRTVREAARRALFQL